MGNAFYPAPIRLVPAPPGVGAGTDAVSESTPEERLSALVGGQLDFVGRLLRNLGAPPDDVSDLMQSAFSITVARLNDIVPGKERAFLIQTAVRLTANARRTRAIGRERTVTEFPDIADSRPSPEDLSDQKRALETLDRVLEAMAIELRTVFVLFEVEEMTTAEISGVLQVPLGTVASRLRRAREDFAARVRRLGLQEQKGNGR
jgi:RNA polymerase sigma-70 factor, ECF subfamily